MCENPGGAMAYPAPPPPLADAHEYNISIEAFKILKFMVTSNRLRKVN